MLIRSMAITLRPESPCYYVEFEFRGKRYRRSAKTRNRQKTQHFERQLRQRVYDRVMLGIAPPDQMTFESAVDRYRRGHLLTTSRRPRTAKATEYMLCRLVKLIGADTLLHLITTPVVAVLKERLLIDGAKPATVNRYLAGLRAILRMAHSNGVCSNKCLGSSSSP